ncbi:DUF2971 domain-containing protein [Paracidovorax valerianellae]|uniref:DUF2971 domain-containing protein n=1 Tax=Paracidovorax valerianellae TaxID=187868 RepID=A0A1G7DHT3_9BURK|nr:DUF2971 domain-containing protein [Paracidovorax valerianellae]MDA8447472.1 DUF2971 domain-containing protein [Paracidovorax valerianellae]SDE50636.1 hypothetical protein SAMN05192589_11927 [Paracidovorax valerianellae]
MRIIGDQELNPCEPLWRYFKTERFLELLQSNELYFASARQFDDPFEGAVAVLPPSFPVDPRYAEREFGDKAFEELRRLTKVSCWHRASYESDAMWQLYAGSRKGVAVRTTLDRIRAAARPFRLKPEYGHEDLWAGNVRYVDLLKERLRVNMMDRFWYKHMAFAWEQEFRLAVSVRMAEEFGVQVPEFGIKVEFDVPRLIERIYLGPLLPETDAMAVRVAARTHGLEDRVRVTSMLGTPRYT